MSQLETLVERATQSELFTAPRLAPDLDRFLTQRGPRMREIAGEACSAGVQTAFFVGSGGSWSSMYSGKYLCDRLTTLASDVVLSYELVWRTPRRLGPDSIVFVASYSGGTEDTLAALRHAQAAGARTVALVRSADTVIGREADECIAYDSPALYALPMAAVTLFALEWARLEGTSGVAEIAEGMQRLPDLIAGSYVADRERGEALAREYLPSQILYCVGGGPLYGLAYKFALTVFMENIRTHGSIIESAEFRHGPAEMLERQRPDMAFLLGTDESRGVTERSLDVARTRGARAFVFDAASYPGLHPLLSPFVLKVPLQWFVVYSALLRGINDLDERVLMGRNLLAEGGEATWP
ncbi:MAG: SIS domain-containing protein [Gaiellales bacterium]